MAKEDKEDKTEVKAEETRTPEVQWSPPKAAVEMFTVEELAEKQGLEPWVLSGLRRAYGWGIGKMLTEADFVRLAKEWLAGPMRRDKR